MDNSYFEYQKGEKKYVFKAKENKSDRSLPKKTPRKLTRFLEKSEFQKSSLGSPYFPGPDAQEAGVWG